VTGGNLQATSDGVSAIQEDGGSLSAFVFPQRFGRSGWVGGFRLGPNPLRVRLATRSDRMGSDW
ncbi:hypothetical protein PIB30_015572, partial [Stylosanthes scabra]|nr:hypothetical protein [Stylosanthes scabra]